MSTRQAIADRVEIEALRGEFTDAVMMRDYDRAASLFTPGGALRMPNVPAELIGREEIRAWGERVPAFVDYLVQTTHPGSIQIDGDTASGRAYLCELIGLRDGRSELNYAIYHDRYQRTGDGWKFAERVYEVRYLDHSPLAGPMPRAFPDQAAPGRAVSRSMTARQPWPWPETMDALLAAPASHRVLLENDQVRVLEVVIEPGTREPEHTHQAASVMIVDEPAGIRYHVGDKVTYESPPRSGPQHWLEPEGPHSVENIDVCRYHAIRVELKSGQHT